MGALVAAREFLHRRDIDRQVGRAIGERDVLHERGVGVNLRGGDIRMALLQPFFEALRPTGAPRRLRVALGRAAPDHHQALRSGGLLEVADILAKLLGEVHLVLALLDVGAVDQLDVIVVEYRLPRLDRLQEGLDLLQQFLFEHARLAGGGIHIVFKNVPAGEDQIVKLRQRDKIFNQRRAAIGALAQAYGRHLGQGTDRGGEATAHGFHASHECGGDRAHPGNHDSKFALGRGNLGDVGSAGRTSILLCRHYVCSPLGSFNSLSSTTGALYANHLRHSAGTPVERPPSLVVWCIFPVETQLARRLRAATFRHIIA